MSVLWVLGKGRGASRDLICTVNPGVCFVERLSEKKANTFPCRGIVEDDAGPALRFHINPGMAEGLSHTAEEFF